MTTGPEATVHVIDDDDAVRESLLFLLSVEGFVGRGFASAEAFLAASPTPPSGCIVTDLRMPGLDGQELLRVLPVAGIRLPIIVMTGHGDAPAAARALAAGAFGFIEKPFHDVAMLEMVRAALGMAPPDPVRDARARETAVRIARLPAAERAMFDGFLQGVASSGTAAALGFDPSDIGMLRARMMRLVGAASLAELVRLVTEARRHAA